MTEDCHGNVSLPQGGQVEGPGTAGRQENYAPHVSVGLSFYLELPDSCRLRYGARGRGHLSFTT